MQATKLIRTWLNEHSLLQRVRAYDHLYVPRSPAKPPSLPHTTLQPPHCRTVAHSDALP